MASSADIETALVVAVTDIVYPATGPLFGAKVTVARGWPTEADIRNAVSNGANLIGIYAIDTIGRDVTTVLRCWKTLSPGIGAMEVGRVEQGFRIDLWANTPDARDALLGLLEPALKFQTRYTLPDGSTATLIRLQAGGPNDRPSRADEWAQSLELTMQYPVLYTQKQPVMLGLTGNNVGVAVIPSSNI